MSQYQIGVFTRSLRQDSFNHKLANAITKLAPSEFLFKQLQISELPLHSQYHDENQAEAAKRLKREVKDAHGLIFVTPEFNRFIPGVLKNAIDHASRPYGKSAQAEKPAGVLGASIDAMGTATEKQHLRNILAGQDMPILGQPDMFIQVRDGLLDKIANIGEEGREFLQN